MTLIVEDGTGLSGAESLISVAEFTAHHLARGNTNVNLLSNQESEEALRRTSDYFLQTYIGRWKGTRTTIVQALDWPRSGITLDEYIAVGVNEVPIAIKQAFADLAFKAASGELLADITPQVIRKKVEGIEVEYQSNTRQTKRYTAIDSMLAQYLKGNSGLSVGLIRS